MSLINEISDVLTFRIVFGAVRGVVVVVMVMLLSLRRHNVVIVVLGIFSADFNSIL